METVAYNFHDEEGKFDNIHLRAGDDAKGVKWLDIDGKTLKLYASHKNFIKLVTEKHGAHWE